MRNVKKLNIYYSMVFIVEQTTKKHNISDIIEI